MFGLIIYTWLHISCAFHDCYYIHDITFASGADACGWYIHVYICIYIYICVCVCVCIAKIWISLAPAAIPAWNLLEVFSTPVQMISNQFHASFRKRSRSLHILWDFKFCTATLTKHHDQTAFVLRGFPFTVKDQENMFLSRMALSVTCRVCQMTTVIRTMGC